MKKAITNFVVSMAAFAMVLISMSFGNIQNCLNKTTYYANKVQAGCYNGTIDTLRGAVNDTFRVTVYCTPTSLNFSNDIWMVAGSPTVAVSCYASNNGGTSYITVPISAYTAYPTNSVTPTTNYYIVNPQFGASPFTSYIWVAANTAGATCSWQGTLNMTQ